jgi:hypothetical protein
MKQTTHCVVVMETKTGKIKAISNLGEQETVLKLQIMQLPIYEPGFYKLVNDLMTLL